MRNMAHLSNPFDGRQLCATIGDKDWFFPDDEEEDFDTLRAKTLNAKALCLACPLTEACLEYALKTPSLEGIWGGKTKSERQATLNRIRRMASYEARK